PASFFIPGPQVPRSQSRRLSREALQHLGCANTGGEHMQAQILRLNLAGQPLEWLSWEEAACLYVRDLVTWTLGGVVQTVRGGINRSGERSKLDLAAIIACGGDRMARPRT